MRETTRRTTPRFSSPVTPAPHSLAAEPSPLRGAVEAVLPRQNPAGLVGSPESETMRHNKKNNSERVLGQRGGWLYACDTLNCCAEVGLSAAAMGVLQDIYTFTHCCGVVVAAGGSGDPTDKRVSRKMGSASSGDRSRALPPPPLLEVLSRRIGRGGMNRTLSTRALGEAARHEKSSPG